MLFNTGTLAFFGIAIFSRLTNAQAVAYGQQLQEDDQTNHWVTWVDGENACPGMQVLNVLTDSPCGQAFQSGEVVYSFTGCTGDGHEPTAILDSGGLQVGGCSTASGKINCHDGLHDIVKHGVCTIVN